MIEQAKPTGTRSERMFAKEQQWTILENVKCQRVATVSGLSKLFDVSEMTIRRDLEKLSDQGLIEPVHGGVLSIEGMVLELIFHEKETVHIEEK